MKIAKETVIEMVRFYDIHCHIAKNYFRKAIETHIQQWKQAGLEKAVSVAMTYNESIRSLELAEKYRDVIIPAVGIHPWKAKKVLSEEQKDKFIQLIEETKNKFPLVLGEIGLDYHFIKDQDRYPYQKQFFAFFLELAEKYGLPINIHIKGAEQDAFEMLSSTSIKPHKILVHWYSGPETILKKFQQMGVYFSINPSILTGSAHKMVATMVPPNQLLTESDGDVKYTIDNERIVGSPILILKSIQRLSELTNVPLESMSETLLENAKSYLMS